MQRQIYKDIDIFLGAKATAKWWLQIIETKLYKSAALFDKLCEISSLADGEHRETFAKEIHDKEVSPIRITQEQAEIFQKYLIDSIIWETKKPQFRVEGNLRLVCNEDLIQSALKTAGIRLKGSSFIDRVYVDILRDGTVTYTDGDETGEICKPSTYSSLFNNQNKSPVDAKQTIASSKKLMY